MPTASLVLLAASPGSPEPAAKVLARHRCWDQTVPTPNLVILSTSLPPAFRKGDGTSAALSCREVSVTAGVNDNCPLDGRASGDTSPLLTEAASANDGKPPASSASLGTYGTQLLGGQEPAPRVHLTLATWQTKAKPSRSTPCLLFCSCCLFLSTSNPGDHRQRQEGLHEQVVAPGPHLLSSLSRSRLQTEKYPPKHTSKAWQWGCPQAVPLATTWGSPGPGRIRPNPEEGAGRPRSIFYCRLRLHWKENNLSFLLYYCYNLRAFPDRILQVPAERYHCQNYKVKCNH